jgi:membrane associated rhomboid family serine protease
MFPLYDDNPSRNQAIAVYGLILVNVLIFMHQVSLSNLQLANFIGNWAFVPSQFFGQPWQFGWRIVTAQFLHGNLLHLLGNMWFLWIFGRSLNEKLGSVRFLGFYLVAGTLAILAQGLVATGSDIPLIGASGAIAGVMGGYIVSFPRAKIQTLLIIIIFVTFVRIPAIVYLGLWFALETIRAATTNPGMPGVAYLAHAAGFAIGMVLVWAIAGKRENL